MVTNMATLIRNDSTGMAVAEEVSLLVEAPLGERTADEQDHRTQRRERDHQPQQGEHASGRPGVDDRSGALCENEHRVSLLLSAQYFSRLASSTEAERRVRKIVMMIASPTTTSAAATTITKKAAI